MTELFWIITLILIGLSFAFILPWVKHFHFKLFLIAALTIGVYTVYAILGSSRFLSQYYSQDDIQARLLLSQSLRPNWIKLQKEKYKLIASLGESSEQEKILKLLQIHGLEALVLNDKAKARAYFEESLSLLPHDSHYQTEKEKLDKIINDLKE